MNIIVIAPSTLPIPPFEGYGGTQRGVYDFLKYFPQHGHKVHLIAPGDSDILELENVRFHPTIDVSTQCINNKESQKKRTEQDELHLVKTLDFVLELREEYGVDLINNRIRSPPFLKSLTDICGNTPIVTSLHAFNESDKRVNDLKKLKGTLHYTAHCFSHKAQYGGLENTSVITYGIDVTAYPYQPTTLTQSESEPKLDMLKKIKNKKKDYFIILSRVARMKGQKTAIELVLEETNKDIIIAGAPVERGQGSGGIRYFNTYIEPYLKKRRVHYFGNADEAQKKELLKYSCGFIFPSGFEDKTWKEPFGRAPVEALACGVPVLAYNQGSLPEIIRPGENGFLFETMDEARALIKDLSVLDRYKCRQSAETYFDAKRVAQDYHELFTNVVEENSEVFEEENDKET